MVAFKIEGELAEQFRRVCGNYGLSQSKFLRAAVDRLLKGSEGERERFLEELGFKKKVSWE
jgi:hypothetical protein